MCRKRAPEYRFICGLDGRKYRRKIGGVTLALYGQQIHSKVLDSGDVQAYTRLGIKRADYPTEGERQAHDFITKYAAENGGAAPSLATFVAQFPDDVCAYISGVTDSFEYLARELKDAAGKRAIVDALTAPALQTLLDEKSTEQFADNLTKTLERIKMETRTGVRRLTDIANATDDFLSEYRARKDGTSFRIWRSKFPAINEQIGGYFGGNTYAWYARSGRGKSVLVMEDGAIEAAFQGATVLVWALEMSEFEWMSRAYSSISARLGVMNARIEGVDYAAGFENKALLMGRLDAEFERGFEDFLRDLNAVIPGRIILRAADSDGFLDRSVSALTADIAEVGADVVVVDPIYLMDYESNTSRVAGGDVAATSVKLKRLAGQTKTVIHVVTQADEDASEKNEDGTRELKPPKRAEIKKSKAILEDAANVFGIDTLAHEGRGVIELGKGRNGGEDTRVELVYLPNYGIVQEIDTAGQAAQFADVSGF